VYDILIAAGVGLLLMLMLWPTRSTGKRLLKSWRVPDPTSAQIEDAIRYLKRRRLLYPWLYVGLTFVPLGTGRGTGSLVAIVLGGTLLAEMLALHPPREGRRREASLTPRGLFDIGSQYVLIGYAVVVAIGIVLLVIDFRLTQLPVLVVSVAAVALVMWAAVARPADGDEQVDRALRTRSVHVSAGLGAAVVGALVGGVFTFVGILAWVLMANTNVVSKKIVW
jgi:prepilin signal peptidase PulO-like enzyme (type II secretory pathway)